MNSYEFDQAIGVIGIVVFIVTVIAIGLALVGGVTVLGWILN